MTHMKAPALNILANSDHKPQNKTMFEPTLKSKLLERLDDYTEKKEMHMFIGTWNVNGRLPTDEKLEIKSWLKPELNFDIYAIGLQEIVDLSSPNTWMSKPDVEAVQQWEKFITDSIPPNYMLLQKKHLVGIALFIFIKKQLNQFIEEEESNQVGVGLLGVAGNKGGVGIRFKLYDSTMCFVNSHLAAHKNNHQGRNQDYARILTNMRFAGPKQRNDKARKVQHVMLEQELSIFDHDCIIWLGDLNYRLNFPMTEMDEVFKRIEKKDWPYLLSKDQLTVERDNHHVFRNFQEGPINFRPTYKFAVGEDNYERKAEKKTRMPAWCDRILWKQGSIGSADLRKIILREYGSCDNQTMSDHKPVYSHMMFMAHKIINEKYEMVKEEIIQQMDKDENLRIPRVEVPKELQFMGAHFDEECQMEFEIKNLGISTVEFLFIDQPYRKPVSWLTINPKSGTVEPRSTATVTLTVHVNEKNVKEVMEADNKLEDILIFSIVRGSDTFVTVTGNYLPSSFGNRIETLVQYSRPIRFADQQPTNKVLCLPKELWRMVDYIYKHGMTTEGLFLAGGSKNEIQEIRECLDVGKEFDKPFSVESMADALIQFLKSMIEPVFPPKKAMQLKSKSQEELTNFCRKALMDIPLSHYNVFIYIVAFLREVLKFSQQNQQSPGLLAIIFSMALMQTKSIEPEHREQSPQFLIMRHFLTCPDFV